MQRQIGGVFVLVTVLLSTSFDWVPVQSQPLTLEQLRYLETERQIAEFYQRIDDDWTEWLATQATSLPAQSIGIITPYSEADSKCKQRPAGEGLASYCAVSNKISIDVIFAYNILQGILFGKPVMSPNDVVLAFSIAHEYGHSFVENAEDIDSASISSKAHEHIADCLGGVWFSWSVQNGDFEASDLGYIETLFATFGSSNSVNQRSHGNSDERMDAVQYGFDTSDPYSCITEYQ